MYTTPSRFMNELKEDIIENFISTVIKNRA